MKKDTKMEISKSSKITDEKKAELIKEYDANTHEISFSFTIPGKPEPYARARFARAGKFVHCYNPKAAIEAKYNVSMKDQLSHENADELKKLLADENSDYSASVYGKFYVPISKSDSIATTVLKEAGKIRPDIRNGDIDNYMKLVLDAMHGVVYNDDKLVTTIHAEKYYSSNPRSELVVTLTIHDKPAK
jgi:Holliday junction resolvase RusA-like endonuclease